jgi:hypothetical protein
MKTLAKQVSKTLAAKRLRIRKANEAFKKMSAPEKRVQIAKDVLKHLRSKKIRPALGKWVRLPANSLNHRSQEVQDVLLNEPRCTACAIGGLFVAAVLRANALKVEELGYCQKLAAQHGDETEIRAEYLFKYLKRFFLAAQLRFIEAAFERGMGGVLPRDTDPILAWESKVVHPRERMILVMKNIIQNKGTFITDKGQKSLRAGSCSLGFTAR